MSTKLLDAVTEYVEANIGSFHEKRLVTVRNQRLAEVLKRKNPYLFKAKYTLTAEQLIRGIMDAFISSQEETLFGDFLEGVAIFVCEQVYNGYKPSPEDLTGIDLVFEKDDQMYIVEIKSGPNWGNSSQVSKMIINFRDSLARLHIKYPDSSIMPVNGCMYGRDSRPRKIGKIKQGGKVIAEVPYQKLCGQDFWYFISDDEQLYVDIIEPLGHQAKQRNDAFQEEYARLINKYTQEFLNTYCSSDGRILWDKLVQFVSENKN